MSAESEREMFDHMPWEALSLHVRIEFLVIEAESIVSHAWYDWTIEQIKKGHT